MRKNSFRVVRDTPEKLGMTQEQWDSPAEVQKRHDRWNARRQARMFQRSKAAAAGMTWEQWQEHKKVLREMPKSSHAEYLRSYRATPRGKAVFDRAAKKAMEKNRREYSLLKAGQPCQDCGGCFHSHAMEWDHRDGEIKSFSISYMGREGRVGRELLAIEIAKCDLVCSNCHRARTARRRQGLPAVLPAPEYEI
jgi:predicted Zn-ribbon and HTH transcriptional regulator